MTFRRQAETSIQENVHAIALLAGIINTNCPEGIPEDQTDGLARMLYQIAGEILVSTKELSFN